MGFHGTPILSPLAIVTPPGGASIAPGASVTYGGLSGYKELVVIAAHTPGGNPIRLNIQFFPFDDPTLIGSLPGWPQQFTGLGGYDATWKIPISCGSITITNNSGIETQKVTVYLTDHEHASVLQVGDSVLPRVFTYSGALAAAGVVTMSAGDLRLPVLTMNGPCTISVFTNTGISCFLFAKFVAANGSLVAIPITDLFTTSGAFTDVAVPIVQTQLQLYSTTVVAAVTVTVTVIPNATG